jgi:hypothetical protein
VICAGVSRGVSCSEQDFLEAAMKASFALAAAAALGCLITAPVAAAFEVQGRSTVPEAGGDRAPGPDDVRQQQYLSDQQAATRGMTSLGATKLGNTTIHFGASRPGMFGGSSNSPFLESPAARTVPSQQR